MIIIKGIFIFLRLLINEKNLEDIIIKYFTGTISDEELSNLKVWVEVPENRRLFIDFVKTNQNLDLAYCSIDTELTYKKISKSVIKNDKPIINYRKRVYKYAALILFFIATSLGIYHGLNSNVSFDVNQITLKLDDGTLKRVDERTEIEIRNSKEEIIAKQKGDLLSYAMYTNEESINSYNELIVPNGKQFKVQLSDGSLIFVNSGSKLRFPVSLNRKKTRDVFLEGEAFFEVKKNMAAPFIVHTKDMNVQVLGTKFNVSSYQNDKNTSVVLKEGSVGITKSSEVFDKKSGIVITSGEQVILKDETFSVNKVSIEKYVAWKDGYLFFENDKFEDIIKKLERYYNIVIENNFVELNDIRFTGSFTKEPINEVLDVFKDLTPFKYQVSDGGKVVIKSIIK